eukprot:3461946-Pyramimonas_sp.AAC.1
MFGHSDSTPVPTLGATVAPRQPCLPVRLAARCPRAAARAPRARARGRTSLATRMTTPTSTATWAAAR